MKSRLKLKETYLFYALSLLFLTTSCSKNDSNSAAIDNATQIINSVVPDAVNDLSAKYKFLDSGKVQVDLTWTQSTSVKSYTIKRGIASKVYDDTYTDVKSPYSIKDLTPGTTQHFIIILTATVNNADVTVTSKEYSITLPLKDLSGKPATFGSVTAVAGDAQVTLSWTASINAKKYLVKRSIGGTLIQTFETTSTSYIDTGLINGTTYTYTVVAVNDNGQTNADADVNISPAQPLTAPGSYTLTASPGDNKAIISWTASAGVTTYTLKRGDSSGQFNKTDFVITTSPFVDSTVVPGQIYYYQMTATNSLGSTLSAEVSVTPRICTAGDLSISNDGDITTFNNTGCVSIVGNLTADASNVTAIEFTNLETISGNLYINENASLTTINFPKLISVNGYAEIYYNNLLTSLDFPSLETVGDLGAKTGDFDSYTNPLLASINLPKLRTVGGYFETWDDHALTVLNIPSLKNTGDALFIGSFSSGGYTMTSLDLSSLETTGGDYWIENLSNITSLNSPKLTSVGGDFIVRNNPLVQSLNFLLLESITGNFVISQDPVLVNLSLPALTSVNNFDVSNNAALKACTIMILIYNNPITIHGTTDNTTNNGGVGDCGIAPLTFSFSDPGIHATSLDISWTAAFGASSYELRRGDISGQYPNLIYSGSDTSFTDTGLTLGNTYYYKVTAINNNGTRDASEVSATTAETLFGILQIAHTDTSMNIGGKSIFYDGTNIFLTGISGHNSVQEIFLKKFDDGGALQNQFLATTNSNAFIYMQPSSMVKDSSGNIFITSVYQSGIFATSICDGTTGHNGYLIKFNSSGVPIWCHDLSIFVGSLATDGSNVYMSAWANGDVMKYDNDGTLLWGVAVYGAYVDPGLTVLGNSVYITGHGTIPTDGFTGLQGPVPYVGSGGGNSYVAKISTNDGHLEAVTRIGVTGTEGYSSGVHTDGTNIYVGLSSSDDLQGNNNYAYIEYDGYIVKLSSDLTTTYWINQQHVDQEIVEYGGFTVDNNGNVYTTGYTSSYYGAPTPGLNGNAFQSAIGDGEDLILLKIDSSGNTLWTKEFGSTNFIDSSGYSYSHGFDVWTDGTTVFVTGLMRGARLGTNPNSTYPNSQSNSIFISKHSAATGNLK